MGRFSAEIAADLRTDEMAAFRQQLEAAFEQLVGEARLQSMEHWITLEVRATSRGYFSVDGEVLDNAGSGNRLVFQFVTEQSVLRNAVLGLRDFDEAFPVVDSPRRK